MSRPLAQGEEATSHDVVALSRVMRRIQGDPSRSAKEKEVLVDHLKAVIGALLLPGKTRRQKSSRAA